MIAGHALLKLVCGQVLHDLGEDGAAKVHSPFCAGARQPKQPNDPSLISNRKIRYTTYRYDFMGLIRAPQVLAGQQ